MPNSACQNQVPQFPAAAKGALFSGRHTAGCRFCTIRHAKFLPFVQAAESPILRQKALYPPFLRENMTTR